MTVPYIWAIQATGNIPTFPHLFLSTHPLSCQLTPMKTGDSTYHLRYESRAFIYHTGEPEGSTLQVIQNTLEGYRRYNGNYWNVQGII
jgi:hypothetical protein